MHHERLSYLLESIAEKNNEIAFAELYRYFFPGLISFAHSIVKDKHRGEEIIEDVFVKIWTNRQTLPAIQNISHYLYVAVKHACLNCVTREKSILFEEIGDDLMMQFNPIEESVIGNENLEKINAAINSLPKRCKLIFRLVKEEGLKYSEVAQLLNISVKTVDSQVYIAVNKIAETLRINLPEYRDYYKSKKT